MRKALCVVATLCIAASLALTTLADATSDARKAIQAAYDKANAAAAKKDLNGIFASFAPDAEIIGPKGEKLSVAALRQQYTQFLTLAQSVKATTKIEKFTLKDKKATVTTREHSELVFSNPQTNKTSKIVDDGTSEDTWVKSAKGWRVTRSKVLTDKQTIDGKPAPGG